MSASALETLPDFATPTLVENRRLPYHRPPSGLRERRKTRSTRLEDAFYLMLRKAKDRYGLKALVLSDDLGLLLAQAPSDVDGRDLAAWCPLAVGPNRRQIAQGKVARALTAILRPNGGGKVRIRRFNTEVAGDMYLCSVGRMDAGALDEVQRSLERILLSAF